MTWEAWDWARQLRAAEEWATAHAHETSLNARAVVPMNCKENYGWRAMVRQGGKYIRAGAVQKGQQ